LRLAEARRMDALKSGRILPGRSVAPAGRRGPFNRLSPALFMPNPYRLLEPYVNAMGETPIPRTRRDVL
jgi:hypothetical protein